MSWKLPSHQLPEGTAESDTWAGVWTQWYSGGPWKVTKWLLCSVVDNALSRGPRGTWPVFGSLSRHGTDTLRSGCSPTGKDRSPASPASKSHECGRAERDAHAE